MSRPDDNKPDASRGTHDADSDDLVVYRHNQQRLKPTGELPPQDWMNQPGVKAVMGALLDNGGDARFVGGCVRDAILKRPVRDIDIATPLTPDQVVARLTQAGIRVVETGLAHGTVTAIIDHQGIEITTLRRDVETNGRHALVAYSESWVEDAGRRDFTINALSCSIDRQIYDPFDGLLDLADGRVRFIGAARNRIQEDYLRILRFFRFYATLGRPPIDRRALAACRQFAANLQGLSAERVQSELFKILDSDRAADVLDIMRAEKILDPILPEAKAIGRLRLLGWLETRALAPGTLAADPIRRLAAVLEGDEAMALGVAHRLRLSNTDAARLGRLKRPCPEITSTLGSADRNIQLYQLGRDDFVDHLLLNWAEERAGDSTRCAAQSVGWTSLLYWAQETEPATFPIKGKDLLALGLQPGPEIGKMLRELQSWWLDQNLSPNAQALLDRAKSRINQAGTDGN